jgi:hypothetical protein
VKYTVQMALFGMVYIQSFMKTGAGVQTTFRFCHRNLIGCNAGITDGRNL